MRYTATGILRCVSNLFPDEINKLIVLVVVVSMLVISISLYLLWPDAVVICYSLVAGQFAYFVEWVLYISLQRLGYHFQATLMCHHMLSRDHPLRYQAVDDHSASENFATCSLNALFRSYDFR